MTSEERRIYDLFADVPGGSDKFKDMIGSARVQRGLRERTQNALEVSDRYLPSMEQTFRGYSLPMQLTRIPLVESSRSEEHTSELQSLMRISYAVFCLKKKKKNTYEQRHAEQI